MEQLKNKNVILITVDCLRADHVGCLGYDRNTTPNIDGLAENGTLFTQAIAQGDKTATSFPAILTSTYPLMFDEYKRVSEPRKMISEVLKEEGYSTAAIHSSPHLSKYFNYDRGFDYFEDFLTSKVPGREKTSIFSTTKSKIFEKMKNKIEWLHSESLTLQKVRRTSIGGIIESIAGWEEVPSAEAINSKAMDWIDDHQNQNFFLWLHYMDVHMPLVPPLKYLRKFSEDPTRLDSTGIARKAKSGKIGKAILEEWMDLYDAEIQHVDQAIGRIARHLKKLDIEGETLVIATADHGEEHLEHGSVGHTSGSLYDEVIRVPLIIQNPRLESKTVEKQVELLSIPPTILDFLGLKKPLEFVGESSISFSEEDEVGKKFVFSEYAQSMESSEIVPPKERKIALRGKNWKFILNLQSGKSELYNLENDPKEKEDLSVKEVTQSEKLKKRVMGHLKWEKEKSKEIRTKKEKSEIREKISTKMDQEGQNLG